MYCTLYNKKKKLKVVKEKIENTIKERYLAININNIKKRYSDELNIKLIFKTLIFSIILWAI